MIFWIWKKDLIKLFKNISAVSEDLLRIYLEVYENSTDNLNNNLGLIEISILIFFQFYCKINRNWLEIVVDATYGLYPILILLNIEFKILRKSPGDEAFQILLKFSRCGWDQRLVDFNRFSSIETKLLLLFSIISPWFYQLSSNQLFTEFWN